MRFLWTERQQEAQAWARSLRRPLLVLVFVQLHASTLARQRSRTLLTIAMPNLRNEVLTRDLGSKSSGLLLT